MADLFGPDAPAVDEEEEKSLIHKKKAKFDALKQKQKKEKEKLKKKKADEIGVAPKEPEGSSDDSEDEYVGACNQDQNPSG